MKGLSRSLTRPHSLSEGVSASLCMYLPPNPVCVTPDGDKEIQKIRSFYLTPKVKQRPIWLKSPHHAGMLSFKAMDDLSQNHS